jgi:hypothetical protein
MVYRNLGLAACLLTVRMLITNRRAQPASSVTSVCLAIALQPFRMHAEDSLVLGDGAVCIWNLVDEHFYTSHQLVDWYHATEHPSQRGQDPTW